MWPCRLSPAFHVRVWLRETTNMQSVQGTYKMSYGSVSKENFSENEWDQCRKEEICRPWRLVHICTSKLLDGALLVIISRSFSWRHWQLLSILLTVSAIRITKLVPRYMHIRAIGVHNCKPYTISVTPLKLREAMRSDCVRSRLLYMSEGMSCKWNAWELRFLNASFFSHPCCPYIAACCFTYCTLSSCSVTAGSSW